MSWLAVTTIFGSMFIGVLISALIVVWCVITSFQNRKGKKWPN